jgi:hypothetical protein
MQEISVLKIGFNIMYAVKGTIKKSGVALVNLTKVNPHQL